MVHPPRRGSRNRAAIALAGVLFDDPDGNLALDEAALAPGQPRAAAPRWPGGRVASAGLEAVGALLADLPVPTEPNAAAAVKMGRPRRIGRLVGEHQLVLWQDEGASWPGSWASKR